MMNKISNKIKPSESLALWSIGTVLIFSVLIAPADNIGLRPLSADGSMAVELPKIPSLFSEKLLAFDPVKILEDIEVVVMSASMTQQVVAQGAKPPATVEKEDDVECLYDPIIAKAANQYNVDPAMVKAIILAESGYNPNAVSKKGAMGLMQLMPVTARELGVKNGFNPEQNIQAGVKYFKQLMNRYRGNVKLALAAYNAGSRNVREYKGVPPFKATRYYIKKVLEYHQHYSNQIGSQEIGSPGVSKS